MPPRKSDAREHSMRVRLSTTEKEMVEALAEHMGMTASDVVRQLVREAFSRRLEHKR